MHPKLAVDPLLWFANFAMEKYWRSSAAVHQQLQGLIQIWYINGTHNQLNLGGMAAMKELARQIQDFSDSHGGSDDVSWSGSRLDSGSQRTGDTMAALLRWHIDRRIEEMKETLPAHRSSVGRVWWYDGGTGDGVVVPGGNVQPPGTVKEVNETVCALNFLGDGQDC